MKSIANWCMRQIALLFAFLLLALAFTWPLAANVSTQILSGTGDEFTAFWPFWYLPKAFLSAEWSILHSNLQIYPDGFSLIYHTNLFVGMLLTAPISLLISPAAALNTYIFLQLVFGAYFFFKFCQAHGLGTLPSIAGGALYGFSPFVTAHLGGHYNLIQVAAPAAALFCGRMICVLAEIKPQDRKLIFFYAIALGTAVWMTAVSDIYIGIMLLVLLVLFSIGDLISHRKIVRTPLLWQAVAVSIIVAGMLMLPWIFELRKVNAGGQYAVRYPAAGSQVVASIESFFLPESGHLLYKMLPTILETRKQAAILESTYLGLGALMVALLGLFTRVQWKTAVVLFAGLITALILSTGNGYTENPGVPRPYDLGRYWPKTGPLQQFRVPARWHFVAVAILAFLAARGLQILTQRPQKVYPILSGVLALILALDLWTGPRPVVTIKPDDYFVNNKLEKRGTLLAFPIGIASGAGGGMGQVHGSQIIDQMAHELPIVSGYLARLSNGVMDNRKADRELATLMALQAGTYRPGARLNWPGFIQRYDICYVTFPKDYRTNLPLMELLTKVFPAAETIETPNFILMKLRR